MYTIKKNVLSVRKCKAVGTWQLGKIIQQATLLLE